MEPGFPALQEESLPAELLGKPKDGLNQEQNHWETFFFGGGDLFKKQPQYF